jgi:hypothetical protein
MTARHGLVTSHCITLILIGQPSSFLVNLKPKKTGDSSHTNPPLACHTQQYAAQITPNTEHKYAPWCYHWPSSCPAAAASALVAILDNNIVSMEPQMGATW